MERLLWKAVGLFILLHNLGSSGIRESTSYIKCTLPPDPKVLCDFTWLVSILFSHLVADYRSFVSLYTLM